MRLRTPSPPPDLAGGAEGSTNAERERGRARRGGSSRARWRTVAAGVVAVALLAGLTWLVGYSDVLAVREVRVDGVDGPLADTVRAAAEAPVGVPLARVDTGRVAERAETVPDVASAAVSRDWPSTLVLTVVPRDPVATVAGEGEWRHVDADGVVFGRLDAPADDLPVIAAADGAGEQERRVAGVSVAGALPRSLQAQVQRIEAASPADVRLVLRDGREVVWGTADDSERKAAVLAVLLDTPAGAYDVSVPDRPTLRPTS